MKAPMQWIREYAAIPEDAQRYVARMVMTGTAVESVETIGEGIDRVVTGRILSMGPPSQFRSSLDLPGGRRRGTPAADCYRARRI